MDNYLTKVRDFFGGMTFDEAAHKYYLDGKPLNASVSTLVHKFVNETDFNAIAKYKDKKAGLPLGTYKTYWKQHADVSLALGTKVHFFGEMYSMYKALEPRDGYEEAIKKFWDSLPSHIVLFIAELKMYHKQELYPGTADIILFNKNTEEFYIGDYKTNANLFNCYKDKRMKAPFDFLKDESFSHYEIQLSYYRLLFEQTGLKIKKTFILHITKDGEYKSYKTRDLTKYLV